MGVEVDLPKPFGPIVISAHAERADVSAVIQMTRLENCVKGDAVVPIQLMTIRHVSVLLTRVQTHVEYGECLNAILAAEAMAKAERN